MIKKAEFVKSSPRWQDCPDTKLPEYAFIGRSNVGKSSLINMLTNNKKLAMTSQKPGKTQLINHFIINDSWYLVDLPGYGYASLSKKQRKEFAKLNLNYITNRQELINLFILIDIRHDAMPIDLDFISQMGGLNIPFSIVFTKADKLSAKATKVQLEKYKEKLSETWDELPPIFVTSAVSRQGRDEITKYIDTINESL